MERQRVITKSSKICPPPFFMHTSRKEGVKNTSNSIADGPCGECMVPLRRGMQLQVWCVMYVANLLNYFLVSLDPLYDLESRGGG